MTCNTRHRVPCIQVTGYLQIAKDEGGLLHTGTKPLKLSERCKYVDIIFVNTFFINSKWSSLLLWTRGGFFIRPTLISGLPDSSRCMQVNQHQHQHQDNFAETGGNLWSGGLHRSVWLWEGGGGEGEQHQVLIKSSSIFSHLKVQVRSLRQRLVRECGQGSQSEPAAGGEKLWTGGVARSGHSFYIFPLEHSLFRLALSGQTAGWWGDILPQSSTQSVLSILSSSLW